MTPADMARLHRAAFTQSRPWSEHEFSGLLATPGTFSVGDSRAFALIRLILDEAELLTIATDPTQQRQGLALELMHDWHARAARLGASVALLDVAEDNAAAQALYARCGYEVVGRRKGYYRRQGQANADALTMQRQLGA